MLRILIKPGDRVFAVEFGHVDGMPWVEPLGAEKIVQGVRDLHPEETSVKAQAYGHDLQTALQMATEAADGGPLVIAGSLYLVGDVLRLLKEKGSP